MTKNKPKRRAGPSGRPLEIKRPLGRPPTGVTPARSVRLSPAIWGAIDVWQHTRLENPMLTSSGAVRRLLVLALVSEGISLPDDIVEGTV